MYYVIGAGKGEIREFEKTLSSQSDTHPYCKHVISKRCTRHKGSLITLTAFCKPKTVREQRSFHPETEVSGNWAKAISETSEVTSQTCTYLCHSPSSSWAAGPAQHPLDPWSPQHVLLGEGQHAVPHGATKAGQELAGECVTTGMPFQSTCYLTDLHPKECVLPRCQDRVLPRLKKSCLQALWFLSAGKLYTPGDSSTRATASASSRTEQLYRVITKLISRLACRKTTNFN